jgi:VIT1/CCC1 family predicted Fe2+/Mn2+ transporter
MMLTLPAPGAGAPMRSVHRFVRSHVNQADTMAEMIFGLIMALGVTAAIRIGTDDLSRRELFVSVAGCNLAWGIVDGVVLVLMRLFERGRMARMVLQARAAPDEEKAFAIILDELPPEIQRLLTADDRANLKALALGLLARANPRRPGMARGDLLHGVSAGLLVILPTIPVVLPYLVFTDVLTAVRVSYAVALVLLFLIGWRWGQIVGGSPWRIGGALIVLGIVLVGITTALGG